MKWKSNSPMSLLFFVFSAYGGKRAGSKLSALTAYFPVLAKGILGKGLIVRGTTTRRLPYWANGSSTRTATGCTDLYSLSVQVWPTAKH